MEVNGGCNLRLSCFLGLLAINQAPLGLPYTHVPRSEHSSSLLNRVSVPAIARQVTVRIIASQGTGSGVLIKHEGQTYTVLTCNHVVDDNHDKHYTVLTADGLKHSGQWLRSTQFGNTDLALVQFTSSQPYQVAVIGSNALSIGDLIYATGFPSWQSTKSDAVDDTRDWGMRAFLITKGKVAMLPKKSLQQGYQIGFTNDVEQGMSGGPVLNQSGQLVGVSGGLKHPLQGIIAFTFADGSVPSQKIFQQMDALSWAIPLAPFQSVAGQQQRSNSHDSEI